MSSYLWDTTLGSMLSDTPERLSDTLANRTDALDKVTDRLANLIARLASVSDALVNLIEASDIPLDTLPNPRAGLSRNDAVETGSAPASGAVAGASPATEERSNAPHRLVCSGAFDPTGGGAGRNTRGRVCSPFQLNRSG